MSRGAGTQEEGAEVVVGGGVVVAVVSTGAVEAVAGGRTVLPLMQMSKAAIRCLPRRGVPFLTTKNVAVAVRSPQLTLICRQPCTEILLLV